MTSCSSKQDSNDSAKLQDAILDSVQYNTFQYFWEGAEPNSGLARERFHTNGIYPQNDKHIVTTGGGGFGLMGLVVGMERGFITREEGVERLNKIISFIESADKFHGAFPHWWDGNTGKVKPFSSYDDGGDLVETAFLVQGLLTVHQYLNQNDTTELELAQRIDTLWKGVEWNWYTQGGQDVLYWHWSPNYDWKMNFPVRGYNECLVMYLLAAASSTYGVPADVYDKGWAESGAINTTSQQEEYELQLRYQGEKAGPLFWAHYSFLGLDPRGLSDKYSTNYFEEMKNYTLINRAYCIRNPKGYKGYGKNSWGLTASYSVDGYVAHAPHENADLGVITPTAALSSIVYTPTESMDVMNYLYSNKDRFWGKYGFYDAYSETSNWYPQAYLAIDQGPILVMIENYRTQLLWNLFMSHPDVKKGLRNLGFQSQHL
ncbi:MULTISPECIES: glucoamylase family protein [Bacteroides]|nr:MULTISPECIES: glucoamylase family protein [Bacteroides]HJD92446.1 beta-glucosidase [Bacteroides coprosuis]